ncbi:MAG: YceI family protein [Candidatus Paceibacterota bacterium]
MKVIISIVAVAIVGALFYFGLNSSTLPEDKTSELATTTSFSLVDLTAGEYEVNPNESNITWIGTKELVGNYEDVGTLSVQTGSFVVNEEGQITTGQVVFDMNSIVGTKTSNTQIGLDRLATHLKSADFFDVATYPTATMNITGVEVNDDGTYLATGSLTIKETTADISFPVNITTDASGRVVINGDLDIDRTNWGLQYGSGSFFSDLGDNVISDIVQVSVNIVANLQN